LTDLEGDACAHLLLYNAQQPWERLNVADTIKVPWQAYLDRGHPLLSDQGRVLATIVADDAHTHDALCGAMSLATCARRYGDGSAFGPSPAGRALFALAAAKHGLGPRDIPPSVSFFKGVRVQDMPPGPQDRVWPATPELQRALLNTADYVEARGEA
jgi:uncharacterized protein YcgI (DUF1989 family)